MGVKKTTDELQADCDNKFPNNMFTYDWETYVNTREKMSIECNRCGHKFEQSIENHLKGKDPCRKCRINGTGGFADAESFIEEAKNIYGENTFDYSQVDFKNLKTPVKIICPEEGHGEFYMEPRYFIENNGSPKCEKCRQKKICDETNKNIAEKVNNYGCTFISAENIVENRRSRKYINYLCHCGNKKIVRRLSDTVLKGIRKQNMTCDECKNKRIHDKYENEFTENSEQFIKECLLEYISCNYVDKTIKYKCICGTEVNKEKRLIDNNPHCEECIGKMKIERKNDEIRQLLNSHGCEFISATNVIKNGISRKDIIYLCKCDAKTEQKRTLDSINRSLANNNITCNACRKDSMEQKSMEEHGVRHRMQSSKVRLDYINSRIGDENDDNKNYYKYEIDGDEYICEGYEKHAIKHLYDEGIYIIYTEYSMLKEEVEDGEEMPQFWYKDERKAERRYYPDILVPAGSNSDIKNNLIIEVKSEFVQLERTDYFKEKKQAVLDAGFDFQCWTFMPNGKLLKIE